MTRWHTTGECVLAALAFILICTTPALSQNPPGGPPPIDRRTNADRMRQQDQSNREWQLRNFGKEIDKPKDRRQVEALMAQTEEDFNRILTLHNEIARALTSNNALNYGFVSDATGEIHKRASRVQSNLNLGLSEEDAAGAGKPEQFEDTEMKDALIKLCKQIRSFVTNPVIENPNTINVEQALKARRDLDSVIQLSGHIKKDAEKRSKN
jgi:hypothetical protein